MDEILAAIQDAEKEMKNQCANNYFSPVTIQVRLFISGGSTTSDKVARTDPRFPKIKDYISGKDKKVN